MLVLLLHFNSGTEGVDSALYSTPKHTLGVTSVLGCTTGSPSLSVCVGSLYNLVEELVLLSRFILNLVNKTVFTLKNPEDSQAPSRALRARKLASIPAVPPLNFVAQSGAFGSRWRTTPSQMSFAPWASSTLQTKRSSSSYTRTYVREDRIAMPSLRIARII